MSGLNEVDCLRGGAEPALQHRVGEVGVVRVVLHRALGCLLVGAGDGVVTRRMPWPLAKRSIQSSRPWCALVGVKFLNERL